MNHEYVGASHCLDCATLAICTLVGENADLRTRLTALEAALKAERAEVSAARELLESTGYYRGWRCDNLYDDGRGNVPRPLEALRAYHKARAATDAARKECGL